MKSSGIKRGLAILATSAMRGGGRTTRSQRKLDRRSAGQCVPGWRKRHALQHRRRGRHGLDEVRRHNTTVSLVAGGTSDIDTMRFQYSIDAGATWVNIGGVIASPNDDGLYAREWNPVADSGLTLPICGIQVRANGHSTLDGLNHPGPASFRSRSPARPRLVALEPGLADVGVWKAAGGAQNVIVSGTPLEQRRCADRHRPPGTASSRSTPSSPVAGTSWKTVFNINGIPERALRLQRTGPGRDGGSHRHRVKPESYRR